ncbi:MFS general substrate transporter [Aspergillus pseudodeflectus]|uniref:MFS general substrate transporter n=1 Tax=Aspergillus pseudodeflectus TaxID=176178 RepID=A0ABR4L1U9_9EURO
MVPYGAGINACFDIAEDIGATPHQATWIVASYPLTQGAFILMGGRVGAIYGHKNTVVAAGGWWVIFHLISGFMRNIISLSVMRALSGIGGAFMMPNAIALLTITFPPGKMRNISVGLFGAMAPIGAAGGSVIPGFFGQLTHWKWLFFFLAILGTLGFALFAFIVPGEPEPFDKGGRIDYIGAYFGVAGLILFNFVWNQAPIVGWDEPYDVGIVLWYMSAWNLTIRDYSLFLNGASYATLAVFGTGAAIISAKLVRHLPAQYILAIGSLSSCAANILIATMPARQSYWAQVFPAMIFTAFGPDFLFTAAQIIASNTVKRQQQGVAGSLIGTLLSYGLSTGLGFAGTVEAYTNRHGQDLVRGYRHGLYLGIGFAACAVLLALFFVRIPRERKEGWGEEDEEDGGHVLSTV